MCNYTNYIHFTYTYTLYIYLQAVVYLAINYLKTFIEIIKYKIVVSFKVTISNNYLKIAKLFGTLRLKLYFKKRIFENQNKKNFNCCSRYVDTEDWNRNLSLSSVVFLSK